MIRSASANRANANPLHNLGLITEFVRAFLDKTLLGKKRPLFDGRTSPVPEAVVTAYGH